MDDDMISVIVPVYNAEKYLNRCVDSILNQTYKNLEIILVDDGSVDSSPNICNEFVSKDSRVKVIHQQNNGVSSARNNGIIASSGQYFTFVDSDDYLENDAYEKCMRILQDKTIDALRFNYYENNGDEECPHVFSFSKEGKINKEEIQELFINNRFHGNVWSLVIKRTNKSIQIRFDENIVIAEDLLYCMEIFFNSSHIYMMKDLLYHYVINKDSVTNNVNKLVSNFYEYVKNYDYSIELLKKYNFMDTGLLMKISTSRYNHIINWHLPKMIKSGFIKESVECLCSDKFSNICLLVDSTDLNLYKKLFLFLVRKKMKISIRIMLYIRNLWLLIH